MLFSFLILAFFLACLKVAFVELHTLKNTAAKSMRSAAETCGAMVEHSIRENITRLEQLITIVSREESGRINEYIRDHQELIDPQGLFYILNHEGIITVTDKQHKDFLGLDFSNLPQIAKGRIVSPIHQSIFTEDPVFTLQFPLADGSILAVEKGLQPIIEIINNLKVAAADGPALFFILTRDGTVVYHPDYRLMQSRSNLGFELQDWSSPDHHGLRWFTLHGQRFLSYSSDLSEELGWTFYAAIPRDAVIRHIVPAVLLQAFTVTATLLVMILLLGWLINHSLSRPIAHLANSMAHIDPMQPDPAALAQEQTATIAELDTINQAFSRLLQRVTSANRELTESELLYRTVTENASDWILWIDPQGTLVYSSPSSLDLTGYAPEEFYADNTLVRNIVHPDDLAFWDQHIEAAGPDYSCTTLEYRIITREGEIKWLGHHCRPLTSEEGEYLGRSTINRDITIKLLARRQLAQEKEQLAVTLRSIGDGVITTDTSGMIRLMNRVAEQLTGWSQQEAEGRQLTEILRLYDGTSGLELPCPVQEIMRCQQTMRLQKNTLLKDRRGREYWIDDSGAPIRDAQSKIIGVVLVFHDVSKQRMLEEEAIKAQRLESLGTLAGGLAHDFNNMLASILGNVSLVSLGLQENSKARAQLATAEKACLAASDLTRQLLTFAKGGAPVKRLLPMRRIIEDAAPLAIHGSACKLDLQISDGLGSAEIDPGQINQVLNNLLLNAVQAMPGGGVITLRAENCMVKAHDPAHPQLAAGPYIRIIVQDQGIGIAPQLLTRIFDPYFTTKDKGSGLGLTSCHSIIRHHHGSIQASSEPGKGACFTVLLPASLDAAPEPVTMVDYQKPPRGEGRVLIMDDESLILDTSCALVEALGYTCRPCTDGEEAIGLYRSAMETGTPFDAVILDLTVPGGLGGKDTAARLLQLDPAARLIVSSGYSNDPVMANAAVCGFRAVLNKPYEILELAQVLREITGREEPAAG